MKTISEGIYIRTELHENELECYRELIEKISEAIDGRLVYVRLTPRVEQDFNFDAKITNYVGIARFIALPVKVEDNSLNSFKIPTLDQ